MSVVALTPWPACLPGCGPLLQDVTAVYPGGLRVFSHLNLVIRAASRYAIVGENVRTEREDRQGLGRGRRRAAGRQAGSERGRESTDKRGLWRTSMAGRWQVDPVEPAEAGPVPHQGRVAPRAGPRGHRGHHHTRKHQAATAGGEQTDRQTAARRDRGWQASAGRQRLSVSLPPSCLTLLLLPARMMMMMVSRSSASTSWTSCPPPPPPRAAMRSPSRPPPTCR